MQKSFALVTMIGDFFLLFSLVQLDSTFQIKKLQRWYVILRRFKTQPPVDKKAVFDQYDLKLRFYDNYQSPLLYLEPNILSKMSVRS